MTTECIIGVVKNREQHLQDTIFEDETFTYSGEDPIVQIKKLRTESCEKLK